MKTTCPNAREIRWAQELLRYDFTIDYQIGSKNPADELWWLLIDEDAEKELVEQNWKILDQLKQSLSENNHSLLNANWWAVTKPIIYDKKNYSWKPCTEMLKILIASAVVSPKMKKLWSNLSNSLYQESS